MKPYTYTHKYLHVNQSTSEVPSLWCRYTYTHKYLHVNQITSEVPSLWCRYTYTHKYPHVNRITLELPSWWFRSLINDLVINKHEGMRYVWFRRSHFIKPLDVLMWTILNWKCRAYDSYANTVMICTYVWYVLEVSSKFLSALCHI